MTAETSHNSAPEGDKPASHEGANAPEGDKPQSILEHLTELRRRLTTSLAVIAVAFIASFFIAEHLYNLLASPLADILLERQGK